MSISFDKLRNMSPKQLLLLAVELSERLDRAETREPIAIVGMACRFPGADSPDEYWKLLSEGRDATSETPADRWDMDALHDPDPDALGRITSRRAGYLADVAGFDAGLFGISPREALTMDPQQRLLLETAWEALERAGQAPDGLHGQSVGVFVGLCNIDHFHRLAAHGRERIDAYLATGNAPSVAAGRLSYCFGSKGPAITVDTACSSSLVSLHLATQSLRSGECRMALAGGVNVICAPEVAIALSRGRMLAPDGRSKAFDAAADGFARGEGCGLVALKRLSDARADGDRIIAVIRGSAVNQDGRSGGITAPNGPSQEAVIRAALADANLAPSDVDYVEAHGTGTPLGDPIEVRALGDAFGDGRKQKLVIGSAKTNIGHLESAAGVAGVIKAALAVDAGVIPKSLHFNTPSPHIAWDEANVVVAAEAMAWPQADAPRRAGVSSFGFSGTNAHVVLEQAAAPTPAPAIANERPIHILPLSAHNAATLRRLGAAYDRALADGADLAALSYAAGVGRARLTHRAAIIARDVAEARAALAALAADAAHPSLRRGEAPANNQADVVFLFGGQGGQHPGMGRALYTHAAKFRETIDRCADIIGAGPDGRRLQDVLFADAGDNAIHRTDWTQPALFAFQHALAAQWRAWGVEPAAVLGHSLGEFAAACAAGVFGFEDGVRLTAARGRLCAAMPPGAMASIFAPEADVAALVSRQPDRIAIAAVNGPDNVVISGAADAVTSIAAAFEAKGLRSQVLRIDMPAHSPLVEGSLDAFEAEARKVAMQAPHIPVAWNVTGGAPLPGDGAPDAGYWRTHMRATVRFAEGLQSLKRDGFTRFLEIGPHGTLTALAAPMLSEGAVLAASLRRDGDDWREIANAVAQLFVSGVNIDWRGWDEGRPRAHVAAPTYPFERRRYWIEAVRPSAHDAADASRTVRLSTRDRTYLADHKVGDRIIASAASHLEAIAGARHAGGALRLRECAFLEAVEIRAEGANLERVPEAPNAYALHKLPREGADAACSRGRFEQPSGFNGARVDVSALQARLSPVNPVAHYEALAGKGVHFGPAFRRIVNAWRGEGEALARIDWRAPIAPDTAFDPASLDAAFQAIGLAATDGAPLRLVSAIDALEIDPPKSGPCFAHARLRPPTGDPDQVFADVTLCNEHGTIFGAIEGISLRAVAPARDAWCYAVAWRQVETPAIVAPQFASPAALASPLEAAWSAAAAEHKLGEYDTLLATLDDLSAAYAARALRTLGFDDTPGRIVILADEAARLRIPAERVRAFEAVLKVSGVCAIEGHGLRVTHRIEASDPEPGYDALLARFAPANGELRLLRRCGANLAEALRGAVDPASLLFPNGGFDDARLVYEQSASARTHNAALAATLRAALAAVPTDARVRVLEIGAGTGATTAHVLAALADREIAYTFTDVSPLFLERAKERFPNARIDYRVLDIETAPAAQGFTEGGYDIVIAANVLHATRDITAAVRHARALLAPGGLMLALEGVHDDAWVELTFGLTDGWRRFTDTDLRKTSPLISRAAWRDVLTASGFDDIVVSRDHAEQGRAGSQQALIVARATASPRSFRVAGAGDALATAIAAELSSRGHRIADGDDAEVVHVASPTGDAAAELTSVHGALARTRARAWIATRGVWPVEGVVSPQGRAQSTAWGIGRAFAVEAPDRMGALIDLDPRATAQDSARRFVDAILRADAEDQIAIRGDRTFVARLTPSGVPQAADFTLRADAAYLVTGGFGGLGPHVGRWLAERGARHVVMLGRKPNEADPRLQAIRQAGAIVHVLAADVANADSLRAAIASLAGRAPPIAGVLHAAASFSTAPFAELTADQIAQMAAPKIAGALALEAVFADADLDFIVHFSSTTALLGAAGFAHYAGANAFLDATAQSRATRPFILTVNWGTWSEMRGVSADTSDTYRQAGLRPMDPDHALDLMGRAIAARLPALAIADIDWSRMKALHEARRARPFLAEIAGDTPDAPVAAGNARLLQQIASASPAQRSDLLTSFVRSEVASVLGSSPGDQPPLDLGLFEMGMDSLMSLELKRRLEQGVGRTLPVTLTFNYPNVRALAGYLDTVFAVAAPVQTGPTADTTSDLDALTDEEVEARLLSLIEST